MLKSKIYITLFTFLFITATANILFAWGVWGHKHINRAAVFALPDSMRIFYYNHIDFLTEGAPVPDLRRGVLNEKDEPPRHYIDIEDFKIPVADLPKTSKEAFAKYDSSFLNKSGYLPWYIETLEAKLTDAFKKKNKSEILFLSAEIGHYIGDAHMPLHTASNYNGQYTGQKGVHALWETQIPELLGYTYNFKTNSAAYINNIPTETWRIITQTHSLEDTLLYIEKKLRRTFDASKLYKKDAAGKTIFLYRQPVFSDEYVKAFSDAMHGMVEMQLRLSIQDLANYWYTAWINAGSPDILELDDAHLTFQNQKNYKLEYKEWKKGKLLNLSVDKE